MQPQDTVLIDLKMDVDLDTEFQRKIMPTSVLYNIATSLGILGNVAVLLVYNFRFKRQEHRYYIPVLAWADLSGCVTNSVYFNTLDVYHVTYPSDPLCRLLSFLVIFNSGVSSHVILIIALQRYLTLCRPFGKQLTARARRLSLVIVTVLALIYGLPASYASGTRGQNMTSTCGIVSEDKKLFQKTYFGCMLFLNLLNILITAGLYLPVLRIVYNSISRLEETTFPENTETNESGETVGGSKVSRAFAKHSMSLTVLCIIIVFIVSFLPSLIIQSLAMKEANVENSTSEINLYHFFGRFYTFNHVLNPIIYLGFDKKFRRKIISLLFNHKTT